MGKEVLDATDGPHTTPFRSAVFAAPVLVCHGDALDRAVAAAAGLIF